MPQYLGVIGADGKIRNVSDLEGYPVMVIGSKVEDAEPVTPDDDEDLSGGVTAGIYLGGEGDLTVITKKGKEVTFTGLSAGTVHPLSVTRVKATGTTATGIVAVY